MKGAKQWNYLVVDFIRAAKVIVNSNAVGTSSR